MGRLSAPLDALITGRTNESLEGCVTLEDVDVDIFLRFAQFVYTGAYQGFAPVERESSAGHVERATPCRNRQILTTIMEAYIRCQNGSIRIDGDLLSYKAGAVG